jgi:hypothetical protein
MSPFYRSDILTSSEPEVVVKEIKKRRRSSATYYYPPRPRSKKAKKKRGRGEKEEAKEEQKEEKELVADVQGSRTNREKSKGIQENRAKEKSRQLAEADRDVAARLSRIPFGDRAAHFPAQEKKVKHISFFLL